jgi:hypothetical protein
MHMKKANPVWQVILGRSHYGGLRIAQQRYLLVTEDDFARAAGVVKVMVEE